MHAEELGFTPEELAAAWVEAMDAPVTIADIGRARRLIRRHPRLRRYEPRGEEITMVGMTLVEMFGSIPPGVSLRKIARELRVCAMIKTLDLATRRRAVAGAN